MNPEKPTLKQRAIFYWTKFYANKKIFWLIVSLFSLIVLITIAGIIFRLMGGGAIKVYQTPTPSPTIEIGVDQEKKKPLDLAKEELIRLENQIKNLDIKQQRLTAPAPNFDIDF